MERFWKRLPVEESDICPSYLHFLTHTFREFHYIPLLGTLQTCAWSMGRHEWAGNDTMGPWAQTCERPPPFLHRTD